MRMLWELAYWYKGFPSLPQINDNEIKRLKILLKQPKIAKSNLFQEIWNDYKWVLSGKQIS